MEERAEEMGAATCLLMPTRYIGPFEGVAVEAMLCGTPVVTTDWGAFSDTVIDGVTGFRCRSLAEMAWAIKEAPKLSRAFIRKHAQGTYAKGVVGHRYADYFNRVAGLWWGGGGWYGEDPYEPKELREYGAFR